MTGADDPELNPKLTSNSICVDALSRLDATLGNARFVWIVFFGAELLWEYMKAAGLPSSNVGGGIAIGILQLAVFVWTDCAALRILASSGRSPWTVDGGLFRYGGLLFAEMLLMALVLFSMNVFVILPALIAFVYCALRFTPWAVALAFDDRTLGFRYGWRLMKGNMLALFGAGMLFLPVGLVLWGFEYAIQHFASVSWGEPAVALFGAVRSALTSMYGSAICVATYCQLTGPERTDS